MLSLCDVRPSGCLSVCPSMGEARRDTMLLHILVLEFCLKIKSAFVSGFPLL